jgi:class 3 adenylate cyclase/tetratricopeptide (TPR) repeat protein/DNA-binding XRE family transcriptional regulator
MADTDESQATDQIFGDVLRALRRAAGLTQAELAERANLSPRGLSDLERGINRHPRRETLLALADAFGLDGEERQRFFEAARRRPRIDPSPVVSPPTVSSASSTGPTPELESTTSVVNSEQTADIQIFLIADVRGYTTYTFEHRDEEAAQLAMRFAQVGREVIEAHSGRVVELRGDEILAVFASARAALRSAVELQQHLAEVSATHPEQPLQCGIGLEAGEAVPVAEGYRGLALNLAARLCSRAKPGEILAGETIIGLARRVAGLVFRDQGLASFKGVATPVRVIQVLPEEAPEVVIEPVREEPGAAAAGGDTARSGEEAPLAVGNFLWARPEHRLVARHSEMSKLLSALQGVQGGVGRLVVLVGEPGVGKTRLAQEVGLVARERGFGIITGRCYAPQETVPYYPFLEALSRAYAAAPVSVRAALPAQWPQVARLLPERQIEVGAAQEGPASGSAEDQQRLFWQVSGFLQALAAERPLALLLDDLHWMDGASLGLLLHLARHTRESPILLIGTYRDLEVPAGHPLARGMSDLGREHLLERIEVQRLEREGTGELLSATLEEGEVSPALTALIHAPTEGNAFFAQEMLRALVERGDVRLVEGRWELRAGVEVVVPENVRVTILERVARLSPPVQQTLSLASVLGQTFRFDDLLSTQALVTPTTQAEPVVESGAPGMAAELALEEFLEEAVSVRLLREAGGVRYAFSHALTQRALYEQLSARRRLRLHLVVAEMLEHLPEREKSRRVEEVAYHFLQAQETVRALPYLLQAGDQAQAVYANAEAEQHFRAAARLAEELGDLEQEALALERLGSLYWWNIGDYELAADALEQAAGAQRASAAGRIRVQTAELLARAYARCGEPDRARQVLAPWLDEQHVESEPPAIQASLLTAFADLRFHIGAYPQQLEAAERAAERWGELGDRRAQMGTLLLRGIALRLLGKWEEGLVVLQEVVSGARDVGALYVCGHASYHVAYSYLQRGEWEQAAATTQVALELSMQSGNQQMYGSASFLQGSLEYQRGDWVAARYWFEQAQQHFSQFHRIAVRAYAPYGQGLIRAVTGELEEGVRYLHQAISICEDGALLFVLHRAQRDMAEVELVQGQAVEARVRLQPMIQSPGCEQYNEITPLLPMLAWACLELGDERMAETLLDRAAPQAEAQYHYLALLDVLRVRGLLYTRMERFLEAEAALHDALLRARSMPHPYAEAKLLYTYGRLEAARGNPEAALERLARAGLICARLGERLYAERIEQETAALGG